MAADNRQTVRFVYNLPYHELTLLCQTLDWNSKWEELGGKHMKFDMMTIHNLRRGVQCGNSPTEDLLTLWGHQNHTVTELFVLLSQMQHYQAMLILKPFVDSRYHALIYEGEGNLSRFLGSSPGKPLSPQSSGQKQEGPSEMETPLQNAGGTLTNSDPRNELPGPSNPLLDKNLNVGSHNLNSVMPNTSPSKVMFPPEPAGERKILNTPEAAMSNDENTSVNSLQNTPLPVQPRLQLQPIAQEGAVGIQADNKENNAPQPNSQRKMSNTSDASSVAEFCCTIPQIEYKELMVATNSWAKQSILGKGGFGTVFKGLWKNTMVAIKRIEQRGAESTESYQAQMEQSLRELRILNACRHDNILPLYGYSMGGDDPCLVYQFMPNGSLEDRLLCRQGTKPLSWSQRHNIAEGTARGLQFLHTNKKPFIHGDIKSANILLDTNFEPRIGDFGLAREGPQNHYTHMKVSRVHGTRPYLPDEFLRGKHLSTKVDTYSFGIVLFELATGLRAYDDSRSTNKFLRDHVGAFDEQQLWTLCDVKAGSYSDTFLHLVALGKLCASHRAKDRPEMEEVLKQLVMYRRIVSRAQQMVCRNSPNPVNPCERQVMLDHRPSPLPYQVPLNLSPEPLNRNNIAVGIQTIIPTIYQQPPHTNIGQVSPSIFPPVQQNNPFFEVNYPRRLIVPHEETGNSPVPSAEDRLLQKVPFIPSHALQGSNVNHGEHEDCIRSGASANGGVSPTFLPQAPQNVAYPASLEISAPPRQMIPTFVGSFSPHPPIAVSPAVSTESLPPVIIDSTYSHSQDMQRIEQSPAAGAFSDSDGLPLISILGLMNSDEAPVPQSFSQESTTTSQHSFKSYLLSHSGPTPKEITN